MLIILPPSETKAWGTIESPINFDSLSFPSLNPTREEVAHDLVSLCQDPEQAVNVLKLSARMRDEVTANTQLLSAATSPAISLYTGVLYDALSPTSLSPSARDALKSKVAIASALFGLSMAEDLIPHYRLAAGAKFNLTKRWRGKLTEALNEAQSGLVIDMRSKAYQKLDDLSGYEGELCTIKVVNEKTGTSISHSSKKHKGLLSRRIMEDCPGVDSIADLLAAIDNLEQNPEDPSELLYKV
ncbi:MAG: peroxide stress protein YaaA [Corynebacterium sp.]|nr:peroxide stress protein YaaA [Corynebacterium sp.]